MTEAASMKITPRLIVGLTIVTLGLIFTLDNLGAIDAGNALDYWPLALVAVGLAKLADAPRTKAWISGSLWVFVGGWWTLWNLGLVEPHVLDLWPILLIVFGLSLVRRAIWSPNRGASDGRRRGGSSKHTAQSSGFAICSGVRRNIVDKEYKGGDYTAIMGGCEIDLREAEIAPGTEAVIEVQAFWGGIDIRVPRSFTVESQVTAILGGFEDNTDQSQADPEQRLIIRGMAMMGGVHVKN